jgi:Ca2+-binding EF-hand superfamily protein
MDSDAVMDMTAEVLVRVDDDESNSISFEEFVKAVDAGLIRVAGQEGDELAAMKKIDDEAEAAAPRPSNSRGGTDLYEDSQAWLAPANDKIVAEFERFDLNSDGKITATEMQAILHTLYGATASCSAIAVDKPDRR